MKAQLTCNGIPIPTRARVDRIISAFQNVMDPAGLMKWRSKDLSEFTPIWGYPSIITEDDVENEVEYMSGEKVEYSHIGQPCWYVTDGHHRTTVLLERGVRFTEVEMDASCFTKYEELKAFRAANR